jgi:EPS-associated MarR family transcriptional regulator
MTIGGGAHLIIPGQCAFWACEFTRCLYLFTHEREFLFLRRERITSVTSGAVAVAPSSDHELSDRAQVQFRVMRAIAQNPNMSQRDLARDLGVSLGGVNYCIKALINKGAVKVENFRASDNKMRYAYVLTPDGMTDKARMTGRFLQRKMREYAALKAEIDGLTEELIDAAANERR